MVADEPLVVAVAAFVIVADAVAVPLVAVAVTIGTYKFVPAATVGVISASPDQLEVPEVLAIFAASNDPAARLTVSEVEEITVVADLLGIYPAVCASLISALVTLWLNAARSTFERVIVALDTEPRPLVLPVVVTLPPGSIVKKLVPSVPDGLVVVTPYTVLPAIVPPTLGVTTGVVVIDTSPAPAVNPPPDKAPPDNSPPEAVPLESPPPDTVHVPSGIAPTLVMT